MTEQRLPNVRQHKGASPRSKAQPVPERPPAVISPARLAAFEILKRVSQGRGHSDDLLHGPAMSHLSQEDRNLATTLVLGTLRWQIALDARVRPLLQRPDVVLVEAVLLALRLGAFQMQYLDRIPPHAAINESVELVRVGGQPQAAGMVNAILRKLATAPKPGQRLHESTAGFAERLGHPLWLVERWVSNYGRNAGRQICEFDQQEPACGELFADSGERASDSGSENSAAALPRMDDGSRLVAEIAAMTSPQAIRIWDCCAAPGGKALILARRLPHAELLATDVSQSRSLWLADRLQREAPGARVKTLAADASELPASEGSFDLILCDVPCSGTGTLARNPEIRHTLQPTDLPRQAARQQAILSAALERLGPDGRLVYSTCSLEPEENEQVVEAVLHHTGGKFVRLPIEPFAAMLAEQGILPGETNLASSLRDGYLRTIPGHGFQGDGFFAAVFARA